ncbi:MAG TPA: hypothetical protein VJB60_03680 [Candidatus Peribacterales bacterium]|nr:hypothetical protein [Candidatus Peribacterales bacterium]
MKNHKWIIAFVVVFVLAVGLVVIIWILPEERAHPFPSTVVQVEEEMEPEQVQTKLSVEEKATELGTYQDLEYGFAIEYPKDFVLKSGRYPYFVIPQNYFSDVSSSVVGADFSIRANDRLIGGCGHLESPNDTYKILRSTSVNGVPFKIGSNFYIGRNTGYPESRSHAGYLYSSKTDSGNCYQFELIVFNSNPAPFNLNEEASQLVELTDQILSTFRFIDAQ